MIGLILCAGRGTRLKEETKDKPKCMVDVGGKPILEHIADHLNKHGIWRIVVNLHLFPEVVMKHFGQRFLYLYEPVPMGEFATTSLMRPWFGEPLIVMNGDTITNLNLIKYCRGVDKMRFISTQTKRHMGTTYSPAHFKLEGDLEVDCEYFDCGTPEKLKLAREHYGL